MQTVIYAKLDSNKKIVGFDYGSSVSPPENSFAISDADMDTVIQHSAHEDAYHVPSLTGYTLSFVPKLANIIADYSTRLNVLCTDTISIGFASLDTVFGCDSYDQNNILRLQFASTGTLKDKAGVQMSLSSSQISTVVMDMNDHIDYCIKQHWSYKEALKKATTTEEAVGIFDTALAFYQERSNLIKSILAK